MDKIDLPGGAWAALRDPDAVTERQRKPYVAAVSRVGNAQETGDGLTALLDVQDALVLALLDSWSFDAPISADALLDLPHKTITALRLAVHPFREELMPDFGPTPDPQSPSAPSNA